MATLFIRYFIPGKQQQFVNNTRSVQWWQLHSPQNLRMSRMI